MVDTMTLNERRLTGRDVLAKTFQSRTKKGYDPVEVDAYLELVATQVDMLHGDLARVGSAETATDTDANVDSQLTEARAQADAAVAARDDIAGSLAAAERQVAESTDTASRLQVELEQRNADLESRTSELDQHRAALGQAQSALEQLQAENQQLRTQLLAVAPPPPVTAAHAAPADSEPESELAASSDVRASEESYELVLRMAQRSAEEAIAEAHQRADQIVAEATEKADQITRESDRKAFEAANRVQAELSSLTEKIEDRNAHLAMIQARAEQQRTELRAFGQRVMDLADSETPRFEGAEVVDLRSSNSSVS